MGYFAQVVLDDIDITEFAIEGSVTTRLNRPGSASVKVHMTDAYAAFGTMFPGPGSYLKIYFYGDNLGTTPVLWHHGRVINCETTADENVGYTVFNSSDPLELWASRPVRDSTGDFSLPTIITDNIFGPQIIEDMCINSECRGGALTPPADCEGPLRLDLNSFAGGVTDLRGAPSDWPMTMMQLANLLISTGTVDVVVTPIEFDASDNYGQLDVYNGDYGTDRTGSVTLSYGMGDFNIRALRWNEDMTQMCNKLWYYLGPKCDDQHWRANITGDDPAFNPDVTATGPWALSTGYIVGDTATFGGNTYAVIQNHTATAANKPGVGADWPQFWTYWMVPPGGRVVPTAGTTNNIIGVRSGISRAHFDVRMDIKIFDASGDGADCTETSVPGHDLYRRLWQVEQYLRAVPMTLVHVTPIRDFGIGLFSIGDLITVEASPDVKGGFSGAQRIYEYTIDWDEDSVPAIGELQVSSDNEGF